MNDTKSMLARVLAQQEAKKDAQAAENQQLGASTERANVVPLKTADQKIQEGGTMLRNRMKANKPRR
jgi:hypothetical protein